MTHTKFLDVPESISCAAVKPFYRPFADVKSAVYAEAERIQSKYRACADPREWKYANYAYNQTSSNACTAINGGARTLACLQEMLIRKGKKITFKRDFEGWLYAVYHALIAKDYSYGGCSLSGMMAAVFQYGSLTGQKPMSDAAMVKLGWNKRAKFPAVFEKYGDKAEKRQIVVTEPATWDDLVACMKAGFACGYGTDRAVRKGSDNIYRLTGKSTAHSMTYAGYCKLDGIEYFGHGNSYNDNMGLIPLEDAKRQHDRRYWTGFVMLDIENET